MAANNALRRTYELMLNPRDRVHGNGVKWINANSANVKYRVLIRRMLLGNACHIIAPILECIVTFELGLQ